MDALRQHDRRLRARILSLGVPRHDVDDVMQTLALQVAGFERETTAGVAAGTVAGRFLAARGLALDWVRRQRRGRARDTLYQQTSADTTSGGAELQLELVELASVLGELRPEVRNAVVAYLFHGEAVSDFAERNGVRAGTVWSWVHEGREALRARLGRPSRRR